MSIRTALHRHLRPRAIAYAHCDIPCGIYDPKAAQTAAETVEKMMTLISELPAAGEGPAAQVEWHQALARCVATKEQHAELVKHEVRVIWGDYFKPPHLEAYPDLHAKVWNIMKRASACYPMGRFGPVRRRPVAEVAFGDRWGKPLSELTMPAAREGATARRT